MRLINMIKMSSLIIALSLAACATYQPPENLNGQSNPTITGSFAEGPGSSTKVVPIEIDGQRIGGTALHFSQIAVTPGPHDIVFSILRAWTFPFQSGSSDIHVTFASGENYVIRVSMPVPSVTPDGQASSWANECEVWVETSDGKPVTSQVPVLLQLANVSPVPIIVPIH